MEPRTGCLQLPFDLFVHYARSAFRRYQKLALTGKLVVWAFITFYISLGTAFFVIGPGTIAQFFYDLAQDLSNLKLGWLILGSVILVTCIPPLTGHTTFVTLCGFAYGMKGFYLAAAASLIGSALVFAVLRSLLAARLRKWTSTNDKWMALDTVIKAKGLPLIILIRISPFPPWVYSNTLFASIESVKLWQFLVGTLFIFPKLLLHVFIGSRLASLSDGDQRKEMDTRTKIINSCLVGASIVVGIIASVVVYRLVQNQLKHLKGIPGDIEELAAEAVDDADEGAPLLNNFSSESVDR